MGYSLLSNNNVTPLEFTISELKDFVDLNPSYPTFYLMLPTNATNIGLYADGHATLAEANQLGDDYTKYVYLVNNRDFKIEGRGRREARPEVRITI